jgi:hypothetical protein
MIPPANVVRSLRCRVRAKINSHSGASAGRADAKRRDAGDVATSSRIPSAARDRRRAPKGCSLAKNRNPMLDFRSIFGLGALPQNLKLFLREPLAGLDAADGGVQSAELANHGQKLVWDRSD